MIRPLTRKEFLALKPDRPHDDEAHFANGASLHWYEDGKTFEEWQPDIGPCKWTLFSHD